MHRAFLSVLVSLIFNLHHSYAARTYFVDSSCSFNNVNRIAATVVPEALSLAATAWNEQNNPDFNNVVNLIYQGITATQNLNLFDDINKISSSNIQLTTSQNDANIIFYCDDDARWRFATDQEVFGNDARPDAKKAWFDPINNIIFDMRNDPTNPDSNRRQPGCLDQSTNAQTYVNSAQSLNVNIAVQPGDKVTITLCSNLYTNKQYLAFADIPEGVNLAATTSKNNKKQPGIDAYRLASVTIVHELSHQILNGHTRYIDSTPNSYGWKNIRAMSLLSSLDNADSLAYTCLAAKLVKMGYSINGNGVVSLTG